MGANVIFERRASAKWEPKPYAARCFNCKGAQLHINDNQQFTWRCAKQDFPTNRDATCKNHEPGKPRVMPLKRL